MKRYELDPMGKKLVEAEGGPWVFYADVERLQGVIGKQESELNRLRKALMHIIWETRSTKIEMLAASAIAGEESE